VLAALELRPHVNLSDIGEIQVETYAAAVFMMGSDPSRWAPTTRETADHSFPYCIAIALLDGEVTRASFAAERLRDPSVAALMSRVRVLEDRELSAMYPEGSPGRVRITMRSGETHVAEVRYPRGHEKNPMTDGEIEAKLMELSVGRLGAARCEKLIRTLWQLERVEDVRTITALLTPQG
jgi:2-methylcitrate dehydratase